MACFQENHHQCHSVDIDLGKTTFYLVALGAVCKVPVKRKFTQSGCWRTRRTFIGLEACAGAHFLSRALRKQGHDVRLIPGQFVKWFVKSNKNEFVDAEAIAEAVERKSMRFVPIKTDDQLDLQAMIGPGQAGLTTHCGDQPDPCLSAGTRPGVCLARFNL